MELSDKAMARMLYGTGLASVLTGVVVGCCDSFGCNIDSEWIKYSVLAAPAVVQGLTAPVFYERLKDSCGTLMGLGAVIGGVETLAGYGAGALFF